MKNNAGIVGASFELQLIQLTPHNSISSERMFIFMSDKDPFNSRYKKNSQDKSIFK